MKSGGSRRVADARRRKTRRKSQTAARAAATSNSPRTIVMRPYFYPSPAVGRAWLRDRPTGPSRIRASKADLHEYTAARRASTQSVRDGIDVKILAY